MTISYADNEFLVKELLFFVKTAFGCQINGKPFKNYHINNWIRIGKVPDAYGGYRIIQVDTQYGCRVITLKGLTREILTDLQTHKSVKIVPPTVKIPLKQRTRLYYEILKKAGKQYKRRTKEAATMPDNWKTIGIKRNQFIR